jgi:hypothetical protein
MQLILNSARIARANSNSASASAARHISAAKPQALVNEWRTPRLRFEALIVTAPKANDGD